MVLKGWRTEVVFVSAAAPTTPLTPLDIILTIPVCFSGPVAANTRVGPLNEPYLRQTNPIQLRVPDNIHRDAFMAVNFAFLRYTRAHSHTHIILYRFKCVCVARNEIIYIYI